MFFQNIHSEHDEIYIIRISACYSVLIIKPKDFHISEKNLVQISDIFNELHLQVKYLEKDFGNKTTDYETLLSETTLAGSPHAVLDEHGICIESPILLSDLQETEYHQNDNLSINLFCNAKTINTNGGTK